MPSTLTEITLLSDNEFLHLETRHKRRFGYPLHCHTEIELNFVEHYHGLRRVVGDSVEDCQGDCELVLIGPRLAHCWEEGERFEETDTYEVTMQFSPKLFDGVIFHNPHFRHIIAMLMRCRQGVCFGPEAIAHVRPLIDNLAHMEPGFYRLQRFMALLYELGEQTDYRLLATESFSMAHTINDNQRIEHVVNYIRQHYTEAIRLDDLARIAYMSPTAFSHFFKERTHKTVSDYLIDERIGHAIRLLVNSQQSVLEICYACGFQNVSNFNRQFRKRRGCTPVQYRAAYRHAQSERRDIATSAEVDEQRAELRPHSRG